MRRLLPLVLALLLTGNALAEGRVTCSVTPSVGGCFYETTVFSVVFLEVAVGADAQAAWRVGRESHLAPYVIVTYYGEPWDVWLEVFAPKLGNVPVIGRPDWFRVGFTWRFE